MDDPCLIAFHQCAKINREMAATIGALPGSSIWAALEACAQKMEEIVADDFPKRQRRDGKEPCGECRLHDGETCDICGAKNIEQTYAGIPMSEHARSGIYGWHPGDEA